MHGSSPTARLLFLCTGNYYRSRFAEELWSDLERREPSGWRADSRGLLVSGGLGNVGPMSPHALLALDSLEIRPVGPPRSPLQVAEEDFASSRHVVAMSAAEHRGMVNALFPSWLNAVEYWDIEDVGICPVHEALERLRVRVGALRRRLGPAGSRRAP